jgi:transposase
MSISIIGLDTAKSVFQVHAVDKGGNTEMRRKVQRDELIPFFEKQEACTVVWRHAVRDTTGHAC